MKSNHDITIQRPDVDIKDIVDISVSDNFKEWKQQFKDKYIKEDGIINSKGILEKFVLKNNPDFKKRLEELFGVEYFREVMYCLLKDMEFIPRCPVCHNLLYLRDWVKGFQQFCSRTCINRYQTTDEWKKTTVVKANKTKVEKNPYKNEILEKHGIIDYYKDPDDANYIIIRNYCKHGDLRVYFNHIILWDRQGRASLCESCNKELYDEYNPVDSDYEDFRKESVQFWKDNGSSLDDCKWMRYFPKEKKIIDSYFLSIGGDSNAAMSEKFYCFNNDLKTIPVCAKSNCGCHAKFRQYNLGYSMYCEKHSMSVHEKSAFEIAVKEYISSLGVNVSENETGYSSGRREFDIVVPDKNIAIECNGGIWHSTIVHTPYYHYLKKKDAAVHGLKLYMLWEDVWNSRNQQAKSMIKKWLGLTKNEKRDYRVFQIQKSIYTHFLSKHYICGDSKSTNYLAYGNDDETIAVAGYSLNSNYAVINTIATRSDCSEECIDVDKFVECIGGNVVVCADTDVVDCDYLNNSKMLKYCGETIDYKWFERGERQDKQSENGWRCYNSGTVYYSNFIYEVGPLCDLSDYMNMSFDDVDTIIRSRYNCVESNGFDWCVETDCGKLFIDFRGKDMIRRAYVGDSFDMDYDSMFAKEEWYKKYRYDDVEKRQRCDSDGLLYLELFSCVDNNDVIMQIDLMISLMSGCKCLEITDDELKSEFEEYKRLSVKDIENITYSTNSNKIVRNFQEAELYKGERDIYLHSSVKRRLLIQNRIFWKRKNENKLSWSELLSGFKISGIYTGYSHFNPDITNWYVCKYSLKSVYDPCGGWGHHMLGMLGCDRVEYNELNQTVCSNVKNICEHFGIENVNVHCGDGTKYIPDSDVDGWFMCPPYMNVEKYGNKQFESVDEYKKFLNDIMDNWKNSSAKVFCVVIREDFVELFNTVPSEVYELNKNMSHFDYKRVSQKKVEKIYIFKK